MSSAAQALRAALTPSITERPAELVEAAGGRAALARRLARIPEGRLPAPGTAARKRYNRTLRQVQRYTTSAGQRRGQGAAGVSSAARERALAQWRRRMGPTWRSAFWRRLRQHGARTRVAGNWRVGGSKDPRRFRVLPPGGPGLPLSGGVMDVILEAAEAGEWREATAYYLEAFSSSYGVEVSPESEDGPEDVAYIKIWVDGDHEPR